VIRVTTLYSSTAASTARYYTRYLTDAPGELPGLWAGQQADLLGITGTVSTEAMERLLSGHDPVSDAVLGMALRDRRLANGKVIRAVAGFDATVSAPKSLSVLWALTGDPGFAEAHDVAVHAVLSHLERFGSTTRIRSNGGRLHPDSQGLIVAGFRQTTSRADDPQLHTHLVISSKVQTDDGRWLALDARLLKRYQRALGGLYQSVLRAELTDRYGVGFGEIVTGQAEIAGVPAELLALFSKRTVQVDDALAVKMAEFYEREGRDPTVWEKAALTREAAADTRVHKTSRSVDELRPGWLADAAEIGVTPETLLLAVHEAGLARDAVADVTVNDVVEVLSAAGSAWHREDVIRAFCDLQRPVPGVGGDRWAQMIEHVADGFIEQHVDLDPGRGVSGRVRGSDGRSEWIEPVAAHITSDEILTQEETILTWAYDAHSSGPDPSINDQGQGLDVLQRDAAAAVAGHDRLVLVIGPAGTGKTTMLRSAVADLGVQGRGVYGVSPTAKAARTLERETGMRSDTVAKLIHEWTRPDRPPETPWRLPHGTTLIVDEASMLGTPSLHQLTELATLNDWRLALIGDPRQLQAVGRGGMFTELCATGRTIELERVHRFEQPWEAEASLLLRHGDSRALDIYQQHHRIRPGTLDEHLDHFAHEWLDHHAAGDNVAIMASTNQHVDLINDRVQSVRHDHEQLDPACPVPIGGSEYAYTGDVIATRRNDRHLTTTSGERVRNRDLWTVTQTHDNGDLTVTPLTGTGTGQITLPADYVSLHVRLGYAATEMGTQSDTVTASLELASHATTCRNLYVAMTRGRHDNTVCVITQTHDLGEARDILDTILTIDRADTPATTQRRTLHTQDRHPYPRSQIPEWFDTLRADTVRQLDQAWDSYNREQQRAAELEQQIADAQRQLEAVNDYARPFNEAVTATQTALDTAKDCREAVREQLATAKRRERRILEPALAIAEQDIHTATATRDQAVTAAQPARTLTAQADTGLSDLREQQWRQRLYEPLFADPERITALQDRIAALDTWHQWANGHQLTPNQINEINTALFVANDTIHEFLTLRRTLFDDPNTAAVIHHIERGLERSPGPELSID
jgi:conjugative relaxase-like TrwC/TraI family protein